MSPQRMLTQRLVRWIGEAAVARPFVSIAAEVGLHEKTVRSVFDEHMQNIRAKVRMNAGSSMAILAAKVMGSRRYLILNAGSKMLVDLVEDPTAEALTDALQSLGKAKEIAHLSIDFDPVAHQAATHCFPAARVFIDPLAVQSLLREGLTAIRISVRAHLEPRQLRGMRGDLKALFTPYDQLNASSLVQLKGLLSRYPALAEAHGFTRTVMGLYGSTSPVCAEEAKARIDLALSQLSPEGRSSFHAFDLQWSHWQLQILNAFSTGAPPPFILGVTDGVEMARLLQQLGREYSISALRARLMCPSGVPAFSISSPGMGISRLRDQVLKAQ
ncbi:transposase [Acidovorax sp. LjRoot129]|uniref:transposase n=1 Tax=unclassified Acidovorax TaxID=2684926 RepID=UPI003ED005A1